MNRGIQIETLPANIGASSCPIRLRLRHTAGYAEICFGVVGIQSVVRDKVEMFVLASSSPIFAGICKLDRSTRHESCEPAVSLPRRANLGVGTTVNAFAIRILLFWHRMSRSAGGLAIPGLLLCTMFVCTWPSKRSHRHGSIWEVPVNCRILIGVHHGELSIPWCSGPSRRELSIRDIFERLAILLPRDSWRRLYPHALSLVDDVEFLLVRGIGDHAVLVLT